MKGSLAVFALMTVWEPGGISASPSHPKQLSPRSVLNRGERDSGRRNVRAQMHTPLSVRIGRDESPGRVCRRLLPPGLDPAPVTIASLVSIEFHVHIRRCLDTRTSRPSRIRFYARPRAT